MSDRRQEPISLEERLILELLESRSGDAIPPETEESAVLRDFVEVLGLVPAALPEVSPRPEVRRRLLETLATAGGGEPAAVMNSRRDAPREVSASRFGSNRLAYLAASVAAALVLVSGWLVVQVQEQRAQIASLSRRVAEARAVSAELASARELLSQARTRLAIATARGAEFCALSPPVGSSAAGARGVLVMAASESEWFLKIEGLAPCPEGRKYTVWFATEDGPIRGPAFDVEAGASVELTLSRRREKIKAVMVTLESEPAPKAPSTKPLLFGDERTQVL